MAIEVIAFDLNGTLLDMAVLDPHFRRVFGEARARERWFEQLQVLWMTTIACGAYEPFDKLAKAALQMVSEREGVALSGADQSAILWQMTELPAYPDVRAGLERLKAAEKYRLVALTNGTMKAAKAQVKFAGIGDLFERVFSVDQVERYKPARQPYEMVAKEMGVKAKQVLLVAAHGWDVEGAMRAGCAAAFVERARQVLNPRQAKPGYRVRDLGELVAEVG